MQQLQLIIPEPCHQNWDDMAPNEQGRFCNSCAKTVVDFTAMTDAQLIHYFQQLKETPICGNITTDQLQRVIESQPVPRKKIFLYWKYILAFFLMAGKGPQSRAQGGIKAKFEETGQKKFPAKDTAIHHELIKIKVTDEYHLPVTSATVRFLSDRKRFAVTDVNGMIVLNKVAAAETLILSGVGYKEKATTIKDIDSGVIVLQRDLKVLNEVVVVSGNSHTRGLLTSAVTRSITLRDTIRNLLVSAVKVYPNPVLRGSAVNVSLKLKKAGTFHLYVMDAAGKLTLSQNYVAADKKSLQQVMIPPAWSKGIYFIIIVNEEGRTIAKEKMVVM